ncbi:hypothetical protein BMF94_4477 [Rhodotorula taiwanensis]|uniref:Quinate transporter n=1 Tax=Rhodotorula taiwanensis TaxID=741276 RepID=A0A2S5B7A1_9BASI|nr:hypothetical protein BMF94_4477 [Rhodotorula taiwanensis]
MPKLFAKFQTPEPAPGSVPPPPETANLRIGLVALVGLSAASLFGYDLGFIGGTIALPSFIKDFHYDHRSAADLANFQSNVVAVFQAGCIFGCLFTAPLSDRFGRRAALMLTSFIYIIGCILMTVAGVGGANASALLLAGRVVSGWAVGASSMLAPVFVAESSPPHLRGRLVGCYEIGVQAGTCLGFWIPRSPEQNIDFYLLSQYISLKHLKNTVAWRMPIALQIVFGGLLSLLLLFVKETPRYIAVKQGAVAAESALARLRKLPASHPYVQEELLGILEQIEHEKTQKAGSYLQIIRESFGPSNRRRLLTGMLIMVSFQMSGTNAINYYAPRIFKSLGLKGTSSSLFASGVYGLVRLVAVIIAMAIVSDRAGRVSMMMVGGAGMAVCLWIVGALIKTHPVAAASKVISPSSYAAITLIYIYAVFFCFSYAGIPWVYCSEIFPLRIRSFNVSITTSTHWAFNLMLGKSVPFMISNIGYATWFVFAACLTVSSVWLYFCVPETRGVPLEQMDQLFGGPSPAEIHAEAMERWAGQDKPESPLHKEDASMSDV